MIPRSYENSFRIRVWNKYMNETAEANKVSEKADLFDSKYAWYVVAVLMLAAVSSFVDRQILNLLVGPIRRDLQISDTSMSLLMGFSFAIFYTILGLPIGRLADTKSRRSIIAVGIAFWSLMTAVCGIVQSFGQLFLARIGVGIGEATLSPSAHSLIADYFPKEKLATAFSVYTTGIYIGSGLAFLLGGLVIGFAKEQGTVDIPLIGPIFHWQVIFLYIGLPGLLIAALALTIREPLRRGSLLIKGAAAAVSIRDVFDHIRANWKTFFCHNIGYSFFIMAGYGGAAWIPTFFIRTYQWTAPQIGLVYGLSIMIFGTIGVLLGGLYSDMLSAKGHQDARIRVGIIASIGLIISTILLTLSPYGWLAAVMLIPANLFATFPIGAAVAAIQPIMPNQMRAQAMALYLFVQNLLGLGLGPTLVALVTDYVFGFDEAVGYSILVINVTALSLAAIILWRGLAPYRDSLTSMNNIIEANNK